MAATIRTVREPGKNRPRPMDTPISTAALSQPAALVAMPIPGAPRRGNRIKDRTILATTFTIVA